MRMRLKNNLLIRLALTLSMISSTAQAQTLKSLTPDQQAREDKIAIKLIEGQVCQKNLLTCQEAFNEVNNSQPHEFWQSTTGEILKGVIFFSLGYGFAKATSK